MKICTNPKCLIEQPQPLTSFSVLRGGLNAKCRACCNAYAAIYRAAHPNKNRIDSAAWRAANPEKAKASDAAYRAANPGKCKTASAAYYAANTGKVRKRVAAWYAANHGRAQNNHLAYYTNNIDSIKAQKATYRAANPEKIRTLNRNRRALKRNIGGKLSTGLAAKLFKLQHGKCPCCKHPLGADYHLDHRMPLFLGGNNTDDNMQLLRAICNLQKGAKHPEDFMRQRGFLL